MILLHSPSPQVSFPKMHPNSPAKNPSCIPKMNNPPPPRYRRVPRMPPSSILPDGSSAPAPIQDPIQHKASIINRHSSSSDGGGPGPPTAALNRGAAAAKKPSFLKRRLTVFRDDRSLSDARKIVNKLLLSALEEPKDHSETEAGNNAATRAGSTSPKRRSGWSAPPVTQLFPKPSVSAALRQPAIPAPTPKPSQTSFYGGPFLEFSTNFESGNLFLAHFVETVLATPNNRAGLEAKPSVVIPPPMGMGGASSSASTSVGGSSASSSSSTLLLNPILTSDVAIHESDVTPSDVGGRGRFVDRDVAIHGSSASQPYTNPITGELMNGGSGGGGTEEGGGGAQGTTPLGGMVAAARDPNHEPMLTSKTLDQLNRDGQRVEYEL